MRLMTAMACTGLACTLTLASPGLTAAPTNTPGRPHPAARTTVLPLSEGRALFRGEPHGYWTPRAGDLRRLERDLPPDLAPYYRQYLGITEGSKRLILINGFSASVAPGFTGGKSDWHKHAVRVMDGGRAFFEATYDPRSRRFTGPRFNGLA